MSFGPFDRTCPVCGDGLPPRGNRRLYVPWRRGFRLVHTGACADAIEAQGTLDLAPDTSFAKRRTRLSPVLLVRARCARQAALDLYEPAKYSAQELLTIRARVLSHEGQKLVGNERLERIHYESKFLRDLIDRALHAPEVCEPTRTELFA